MGSYIYTTKPSAIAEVEVETKTGRSVIKVACYEYAFKPYYSHIDLNEKLERRYVDPSRRAWDRAKREGKVMPEFGTMIHGKKLEVGTQVFPTHRRVTILDDDAFENSVGIITRIIRKRAAA